MEEEGGLEEPGNEGIEQQLVLMPEEPRIEADLEGIEVADWPKQDGLFIIPPETRLEVLRQCHDSKVAGHLGKARTQELVSRNSHGIAGRKTSHPMLLELALPEIDIQEKPRSFGRSEVAQMVEFASNSTAASTNTRTFAI